MNPVECQHCKGTGEDPKYRTVIKMVNNKPKTIRKGTGCPVCLGKGFLYE